MINEAAAKQFWPNENPVGQRIHVGPPFVPGTDMRADIARIQRWYKPHRGRNHDVVQPAD